MPGGRYHSRRLRRRRQRQEVVERLCLTLDKENWKVIRDKNALHPGRPDFRLHEDAGPSTFGHRGFERKIPALALLRD